jgi:hypothetical protein
MAHKMDSVPPLVRAPTTWASPLSMDADMATVSVSNLRSDGKARGLRPFSWLKMLEACRRKACIS